MEVQTLSLDGLKLIRPRLFPDGRGLFFEAYRHPLYTEAGIICTFPQDNHSVSCRGTLRGMHFQTAPGQAKLMRVAVGRIFDVAVDIRPNSPTFGRWEGVILDDEEHHQLFVPVGFAHGFCVLSEVAHVLYKVSSVYDGATESGFRYDDPSVGIEWPIEQPILSERDQRAPLLEELGLR